MANSSFGPEPVIRKDLVERIPAEIDYICPETGRTSCRGFVWLQEEILVAFETGSEYRAHGEMFVLRSGRLLDTGRVIFEGKDGLTDVTCILNQDTLEGEFLHPAHPSTITIHY